MTQPNISDLIVLVADGTMEKVIESILQRPESLGIRELRSYPKILVHPQHDAGCCEDGVDLLANYVDRYHHALLVFDYEGCGLETKLPQDLEVEFDNALRNIGWGDRASVVVLDPELEIWIWSDSPHVPRALGWKGSYSELKQWLEAKGLWETGRSKPFRPKEAVEIVLKQYRIPRTSSLYSQLASKVSLNRCTDRAFTRFKSILQEWFPGDSSVPSPVSE